jgi:predicted transcriptional regulator
MQAVLAGNQNDNGPEAGAGSDYDRWLTSIVLQGLTINRILPASYVEHSIPVLLMGLAKASLDGHGLTASDIAMASNVNLNITRRYLALFEKDGYTRRDPKNQDAYLLTEFGESFVWKIWIECRKLQK